MLPLPWHRVSAVVLDDAAHATTPQLAAGAAICLEDAIVLGEELARGGELPDEPGADPAAFTAAATQAPAEPF